MTFPFNPTIEVDIPIFYHVTTTRMDAKNKNMDGLVRHVVDNKTWAHIDETWLDFAIEPHNLKLAISTYGFNPFCEKLCKWSTWPMYILIYNLSPWLTTKRFLVLVALIILRKKSVNMSNIDVLLQPLVYELKMLWKLSVQVFDFGKPKGHCSFILCAMVMWTINDFLRYGFLSRCVHQRYVAWPKCEPQTTS
jgi:hypothetical protein